MLKKFKNRLGSDGGSAELISALFILPLVIALLFTMIDAALYFNNRSIVQGIARDGARSVAVMGGGGTAAEGTPIELKYGISRDSACANLSGNTMVSDAYTGESTPIECNIMKSLMESKSLVNVRVQKVQCSPQVTTSISERTSCSVEWSYGSIPASALVLIKMKDGKGMGSSNISVGTAESEVSLAPTSLSSR